MISGNFAHNSVEMHTIKIPGCHVRNVMVTARNLTLIPGLDKIDAFLGPNVQAVC